MIRHSVRARRTHYEPAASPGVAALGWDDELTLALRAAGVSAEDVDRYFSPAGVMRRASARVAGAPVRKPCRR